jgi:hypothetical protein
MLPSSLIPPLDFSLHGFLQKLGIPSNILRVFRIYHLYDMLFDHSVSARAVQVY